MSWYRLNSWSSSPFPSSYIEALTPSVGVSGDEASKEITAMKLNNAYSLEGKLWPT